MFGAKYSRAKFWVATLSVFLIWLFVVVLSVFLGEPDLEIIAGGVGVLALINILANRIRDYGSSPWLALWSFFPFVGLIQAFYFGIKHKNDDVNGPTPSNKHKHQHDDSHLYEMATAEFENNRNEALWIKATVVCEGDVEKAKYFYIKARVQLLQSDESIPSQPVDVWESLARIDKTKERINW